MCGHWVGDGVGLYRLVESQTQSLQPGDWYFAGRVRAAPAPAYGSECVWPAVAQQVQPTQLSFFKCDESNQHSVQVRVANMLTSKHIQEPLKSTEQACSLQQEAKPILPWLAVLLTLCSALIS